MQQSSVQQVIDIFLSVVESHKPLLSKLNMAELQLELDKVRFQSCYTIQWLLWDNTIVCGISLFEAH